MIIRIFRFNVYYTSYYIVQRGYKMVNGIGSNSVFTYKVQKNTKKKKNRLKVSIKSNWIRIICLDIKKKITLSLKKL